MSTIKIKIDGHKFQGIVKERTNGSRPANDGTAHIMVQTIFVDLDVMLKLSADVAPPPAEVEISGVWKDAVIDRIPTAPKFLRIMLSFEE